MVTTKDYLFPARSLKEPLTLKISDDYSSYGKKFVKKKNYNLEVILLLCITLRMIFGRIFKNFELRFYQILEDFDFTVKCIVRKVTSIKKTFSCTGTKTS